MLRLLAALVGYCLFAGRAHAEGPVRVYSLNLQYQKILNNYDPMLADVPHKSWGDHVELNSGLEIWDVIFWDSKFHYESAYQKVVAVGWQFETGFHMGKYFDAIYSHHSRHSADRMNSSDEVNKYPLEDYAGIRVNFVSEPRRRP